MAVAEKLSVPPAVKPAFDRVARESVAPVALTLFGLAALFVVVDSLVIPPPRYARAVPLVDLVAALAYFAIWLLAVRGKLRPDHGSHAIAAVGLVATLDIAATMWMLEDPEQSLYMMLVALGAGVILLSTIHVIFTVVTILGAFTTVAFLHPHIDWATFGLALFSACAASILAHAVRKRTYIRLELLRLEERAHREALLAREEALQTAVREARESEDRYRRLVEGTPDAFLVISDRRIIFVNQAAVKLFDAKDAEDLLGRDALSLVHPDFRARIAERTDRIQARDVATQRLDLKVLTVTGRVVEAETMGLPIRFGNKTVDLTLVRDLTERRAAERQSRLAQLRLDEIGRLREMDKMKTQFINTLSHELRTPLTPIRVQLRLLREPKTLADPDKRKRVSDMLERNVDRLGDLLDELLEVARLQSGRLKLSKEETDVGKLLGEALESFDDPARAAGVELVRELDKGIVASIDPKRLTQVAFNLLGNSLKFTPSGGTIRMTLRREGEDQFSVAVADTGNGIRPEDIEKLFQPFRQVHDTMNQTQAGTGLGLFICRGIVEGHGGQITCESAGLGKGTTFKFTMPLHADAPAAGPADGA